MISKNDDQYGTMIFIIRESNPKEMVILTIGENIYYIHNPDKSAFLYGNCVYPGNAIKSALKELCIKKDNMSVIPTIFQLEVVIHREYCLKLYENLIWSKDSAFSELGLEQFLKSFSDKYRLGIV